MTRPVEYRVREGARFTITRWDPETGGSREVGGEHRTEEGAVEVAVLMADRENAGGRHVASAYGVERPEGDASRAGREARTAASAFRKGITHGENPRGLSGLPWAFDSAARLLESAKQGETGPYVALSELEYARVTAFTPALASVFRLAVELLGDEVGAPREKAPAPDDGAVFVGVARSWLEVAGRHALGQDASKTPETRAAALADAVTRADLELLRWQEKAREARTAASSPQGPITHGAISGGLSGAPCASVSGEGRFDAASALAMTARARFQDAAVNAGNGALSLALTSAELGLRDLRRALELAAGPAPEEGPIKRGASHWDGYTNAGPAKDTVSDVAAAGASGMRVDKPFSPETVEALEDGLRKAAASLAQQAKPGPGGVEWTKRHAADFGEPTEWTARYRGWDLVVTAPRRAKDLFTTYEATAPGRTRLHGRAMRPEKAALLAMEAVDNAPVQPFEEAVAEADVPQELKDRWLDVTPTAGHFGSLLEPSQETRQMEGVLWVKVSHAPEEWRATVSLCQATVTAKPDGAWEYGVDVLDAAYAGPERGRHVGGGGRPTMDEAVHAAVRMLHGGRAMSIAATAATDPAVLEALDHSGRLADAARLKAAALAEEEREDAIPYRDMVKAIAEASDAERVTLLRGWAVHCEGLADTTFRSREAVRGMRALAQALEDAIPETDGEAVHLAVMGLHRALGRPLAGHLGVEDLAEVDWHGWLATDAADLLREHLPAPKGEAIPTPEGAPLGEDGAFRPDLVDALIDRRLDEDRAVLSSAPGTDSPARRVRLAMGDLEEVLGRLVPMRDNGVMQVREGVRRALGTLGTVASVLETARIDEGDLQQDRMATIREMAEDRGQLAPEVAHRERWTLRVVEPGDYGRLLSVECLRDGKPYSVMAFGSGGGVNREHKMLYSLGRRVGRLLEQGHEVVVEGGPWWLDSDPSRVDRAPNGPGAPSDGAEGETVDE